MRERVRVLWPLLLSIACSGEATPSEPPAVAAVAGAQVGSGGAGGGVESAGGSVAAAGIGGMGVGGIGVGVGVGGIGVGGEVGGGIDGSSGTAGGATNPLPTTQLKHPGILNDAQQLSFIKGQVQARHEPWLSAFNALEKSDYASLSYQAKPFAVVECGSYNNPNIGCSQLVDDGMAAYAHALLWSLTGQPAHADKAIAIIDGWAKLYQKNVESNSNLVVGWATPWYANAAELLRYSSSGWSAAALQRFTALLGLWLPYVDQDEGPTNNWMQSRIEAHMAIAVFLDDPSELERAVARWRSWLPKYILESGVGSETCRDLGHLGLGVRSLLYAAETAWQQGIDLFSPNQGRLSKFIELHGAWMLGKVAVPSTVCGGTILARERDTEGIAPPTGGGRMPLEILYAHLHDRLGQQLPSLREMIRSGRPSGSSHWVTKWETLSHGQPL